MGKKIVVHVHTTDQDYKRDETGKFAEGDRVKAHDRYGGKTGHVTSSAPSGSFHVVKHDDGSTSSYHESDLSHHEDDDDDDDDRRTADAARPNWLTGLQALRAKVMDAGFDESKVKRDAGGKFSHTNAAATHTKAAQEHEAAMGKIGTKNLSPAQKAQFDRHDHARRIHKEAAEAHTTAANHFAAKTGHGDHYAKQAHSWTASANKASAAAHGRTPPNPDDELVSVPTAGSGKETTFAIPKPPAGMPGGPVKGRGPVDLGNQKKANK